MDARRDIPGVKGCCGTGDYRARPGEMQVEGAGVAGRFQVLHYFPQNRLPPPFRGAILT